MSEALDLIAREGWVFWPSALALFLAIGSFLNVVIHRVPGQIEWSWQMPNARGAKPPGVIWPGSHCPKCQHSLAWHDNIPLLSYLLLKGHCRYCKTSISARYPLVEALCAIVSLIVVAKLGVQWPTLFALLATWFLVALAFIDLEHFLLPDKLTFPLIAIGIGVNAFELFASLSSAVIGAAAGYLSLWLVFHGFRLATGKEGLGYGDFKLLAAIGAWVGWQLLPVAVLLSAGAGTIIGIMMLATGHQKRNQPIPFGPYLAGGGWLTLLWGHEIQKWYYSLTGM